MPVSTAREPIEQVNLKMRKSSARKLYAMQRRLAKLNPAMREPSLADTVSYAIEKLAEFLDDPIDAYKNMKG